MYYIVLDLFSITPTLTSVSCLSAWGMLGSRSWRRGWPLRIHRRIHNNRSHATCTHTMHRWGRRETERSVARWFSASTQAGLLGGGQTVHNKGTGTHGRMNLAQGLVRLLAMMRTDTHNLRGPPLRHDGRRGGRWSDGGDGEWSWKQCQEAPGFWWPSTWRRLVLAPVCSPWGRHGQPWPRHTWNQAACKHSGDCRRSCTPPKTATIISWLVYMALGKTFGNIGQAFCNRALSNPLIGHYEPKWKRNIFN